MGDVVDVFDLDFQRVDRFDVCSRRDAGDRGGSVQEFEGFPLRQFSGGDEGVLVFAPEAVVGGDSDAFAVGCGQVQNRRSLVVAVDAGD